MKGPLEGSGFGILQELLDQVIVLLKDPATTYGQTMSRFLLTTVQNIIIIFFFHDAVHWNKAPNTTAPKHDPPSNMFNLENCVIRVEELSLSLPKHEQHPCTQTVPV